LVYWDELDTLQPLRGTADPSRSLDLDGLLLRLEFAARLLPGKLRRSLSFVATSDHGQVPADLEHRLAVDAVGPLTDSMAWPMAGDRRAGYFGAKAGRREDLREALLAALPPGAHLLEMGRALDAGLFGPPPFHPEVRERLGDFLALVPPPWALTYRVPGTPEPTRYLVGAHGGLHPDELLVPLVAGPLDDLLDLGRPRPRQP
jgi:hypothetical protein